MHCGFVPRKRRKIPIGHSNSKVEMLQSYELSLHASHNKFEYIIKNDTNMYTV